MDRICPTAVGSLARIWSALHSDLSLEIDPGDACYLRNVVFQMDDDLVAGLLALKLAKARRPLEPWRTNDLARLGSDVLYSVQGRRSRARLVHGAVVGDGLLGIETRFGAALLGLRAGQSLLWPHEVGRLVEVRAIEVAPGLARSASVRTSRNHSQTPCSSG